ncbi:FlgD immunoglobulin-like domain containing protein [Candidatus Poribacteria bacterium]
MFRIHNYAALYLVLLLMLLTPGLAVCVESPEATHLYSFSEGLHAPIRIATDAADNVYVTDTRKHRVCVLDASGGLLRHIYGMQIPLGIAVDGQDRLYVGDRGTGSVSILTPEGISIGKLGAGNGQFTMPTDIAIDSQSNIYVVDSKENCVKVFDENGNYKFQFGDSVLAFPTGIAIDEANDAVLVGQYGRAQNNNITASIQIFDMKGNRKGSIGSYGGGAGKFTRIQGIAVDNQGRIYVADCFQSTVQVVDYAGDFLSFIGSFGTNPGELRLPSDVAFDSSNRLWTTSTNNGAVEVFSIDAYNSPSQQEAQNSFTIGLAAGFNFISVPLKPAKEWRLSDLAAHIGGEVISIVVYSPKRGGAFCYLPGFPENDPANVTVEGSEGYIVVMAEAKSVAFQGTAWEGEVTFPAGMSMFAVPLQPDTELQFGDLANHIGDELTHLITHTNRFETYTPGEDSSSSVPIEGGVGYIAVMSEAKTVTFEGEPWRNEPSNLLAPGYYDAAQASSAPVLVVLGKALDLETGDIPEGVSIQIKDLDTGTAETATTNSLGDYAVAFIDLLGNDGTGAPTVRKPGDVIQAKVIDPRRISESVNYTLTAEDIRLNHVALPAIQLEVMPTESVLLPNYPNPFNPETWIPYRLGQDEEVKIEIYDLSGQQVRTLTLGEKAAGNYVSRHKAAYWDGANNAGEAVASGIYFYVIRAGEFEAVRRMAILR